MKNPLRRIHRGLTLIELSIAIMIGMATGSMVMVLFNQQLAFLDIYKKQGFLTEEAPIISMYVSRLIGKADRFSFHRSANDAKDNRAPFLGEEANFLRLTFRAPDGTEKATILAFENNALYYYVVRDGQPLGTPQWALTRAPRRVFFTVEEGVLQMTLIGPNQEKITYAGTMQQ